MLHAIQYLKGYLCIRVWGFSPERFMNLCGNHNILLWNIKNHGDYYTMCVTLKGFYSLKSITRKTGTRVAITKRCGLPFFSQKVKKRKIFVAGLLLSFVFWIWMESFVLNIEVRGNYYITEDVFMDFLEENNIAPGIKKKNINIEELEKSIRNEYNLVTWTSAKIDGARLIIHIKENELIQNPSRNNDSENAGNEGYHLVADTDGIVTEMITRSGNPKVSIGMEVKKGDILVEGCIPIYKEDMSIKRYDYCKADADVIVESKVSVNQKQKEAYVKKIYTVETKTRYFLGLSSLEIKFPFAFSRYDNYDMIKEYEQIELFGGLKIPVFYGKIQLREYQEEESVYTKEEIKRNFEQKIQKFVKTLEEKGVQIIEKNVTIKKQKGVWTLQVDFVVRQRADAYEKIKMPQPENMDNIKDIQEQNLHEDTAQ